MGRTYDITEIFILFHMLNLIIIIEIKFRFHRFAKTHDFSFRFIYYHLVFRTEIVEAIQ